MKAKTIILTAAALATVLLVGCSDDSERYSVNDKHCQQAYWNQLPKNSKLDELVTECTRVSMEEAKTYIFAAATLAELLLGSDNRKKQCGAYWTQPLPYAPTRQLMEVCW